MNNKLLVQDYLMTHSLVDLARDHGIKHRLHDNKKFSLNYDQIESKESDKLACQCRGLILSKPDYSIIDENAVIGETMVLCRPFDRFFNVGQTYAASVDLEEAKGTKIFEKLDGSATFLHWDSFKNEWHIATRSVPEANLPIDNILDYTFRTLFEKAIEDCTIYSSFQEWVDGVKPSKQNTYIFELCTPVNRIVVDYKNYSVNLIGMRNTVSGQEYSIENGRYLGVPLCGTYSLGNMSEMVDFVSNFNPLEHEGVVVCDENFNRVKVKNPSYLALNRVRDAVAKSPRALLELCLQEKMDDAFSLIPDHLKNKALETQESLQKFIRYANDSFYTLVEAAKKNITDSSEKELRKQLALVVRKENMILMPYVMGRYSGQFKNYREFIDNHKDKKTGEFPKPFLDNMLGWLKKV